MIELSIIAKATAILVLGLLAAGFAQKARASVRHRSSSDCASQFADAGIRSRRPRREPRIFANDSDRRDGCAQFRHVADDDHQDRLGYWCGAVAPFADGKSVAFAAAAVDRADGGNCEMARWRNGENAEV